MLNNMVRRRCCECADHQCPLHEGYDCQRGAALRLYRADMNGIGVDFCRPCSLDAEASGLFSIRPLRP